MTDVLTGLCVLLRCPVTGQQLHLATPEELHTFSTRMSHCADGLLVLEDSTAAYPVKGGIPSLLPESLQLLS